MGFLQAVSALGTLNVNEGQEEYINFLEPPFEQKENSKFKNYVIRVGLKVENKNSEILSVQGIKSIDFSEYPGIEKDKILQTFLYRKVSGNVSKSFTPLYRIGKPGSDADAGKMKLLFKDKLEKAEKWSADDYNAGDWAFNKESRLYKINKMILQNYEKENVFEKGSVELIMRELESRADELCEYWADKNGSYILLFGIHDNEGDRFLYPGEIDAFVSYFKNEVSSLMGKSEDVSLKKPKENSKISKPIGKCSLCDCESDNMNTPDKLFPFATFDKESFLPGSKNKSGAAEKVFPICRDCFIKISAGKTKMETHLKDTFIVPGYTLYVVPELIGSNERLETATNKTKDFFKVGLKTEERTFTRLLNMDEYLVYHFLFVEINQAQQRIHFMIEDVPPSRLKSLQKSWQFSCQTWIKNSTFDETENGGLKYSETYDLDDAFSQIYWLFRDLAGQSDQEQKFMREEALLVMADLLNQEHIEIKNIKQLIVSRLPGLFSNPEWISPRGKKYGKTKLVEMARILDFIERTNQKGSERNEIGLDE